MAVKSDSVKMEKDNSIVIELFEDLRSLIQGQDSKIQGLRLELIEQSKLIVCLQNEIQHAKIDLQQDNQDLKREVETVKVSVLSSHPSPVSTRPRTSSPGMISLKPSACRGESSDLDPS